MRGRGRYTPYFTCGGACPNDIRCATAAHHDCSTQRIDHGSEALANFMLGRANAIDSTISLLDRRVHRASAYSQSMQATNGNNFPINRRPLNFASLLCRINPAHATRKIDFSLFPRRLRQLRLRISRLSITPLFMQAYICVFYHYFEHIIANTLRLTYITEILNNVAKIKTHSNQKQISIDNFARLYSFIHSFIITPQRQHILQYI